MPQQGLFSTVDASPKHTMQGFAGAMCTYGTVNMAPLITTIGGSTDRSYNDVRIEWSEKQPITGINYIVSNQGDGMSCTLTFAEGCFVTENTLFMVIETGEILFVVGVSDNVVTVERGFAGSTILPIVPDASSDVVVQRIGTAFPEGSDRPDPFSFYTTSKINYNQIFRNTWAVTRTAAQLNYRDGDLKKRLKKDALMMHVRDIELTILFGVKSMGYQNSQPLRTMDGLYRQISTNIASPADGILTAPMLDDFIERSFYHTIDGKANTRIAICGHGFITLVNRLARLSTQYHVSGTMTKYGQAVTEWITPHGSLMLMPHYLLSEIPGYRNDLIVLHPDAISLHYLYEGHEDHMGIQGNQGVDAHVGGIISELTMKLCGELTCGILTGVCDVAGESQPFYLAEPHVSVPNGGC